MDVKKVDKPDKIEYFVDEKGNKLPIEDLANKARVKQERNKGDFTEYLLKLAMSRKKIILHTWLYRGMEGVILNVDLKSRTFIFYSAMSKTKNLYSINVVRGIEGI